MRMILVRVFIMISISLLTACSSMSGNVVPKKGPTMEQVYDGMAVSTPHHASLYNEHKKISQTMGVPLHVASSLPRSAVTQEFHKLLNPELPLYVFPHLAGKDDLPVPGYFTVFNAYEHDHYALPNEMARG